MNDFWKKSERTFRWSRAKRERSFDSYLRFRKRAVVQAVLPKTCGANQIVPPPAPMTNRRRLGAKVRSKRKSRQSPLPTLNSRDRRLNEDHARWLAVLGVNNTITGRLFMRGFPVFWSDQKRPFTPRLQLDPYLLLVWTNPS